MVAIVLIPVIAGTVLNRLFPRAAAAVSGVLPLIAILLVIFDERSSLGLVRLRVKRAGVEMERIFEEMDRRATGSLPEGSRAGPFLEITDEDIDSLFSE